MLVFTGEALLRHSHLQVHAHAHARGGGGGRGSVTQMRTSVFNVCVRSGAMSRLFPMSRKRVHGHLYTARCAAAAPDTA